MSARFEEARKHREYRNYAAAIPLYEQCLADMPSSVDVAFELANCYIHDPHQPRYKDAANLLLRVLQQLPDNCLILNELGVCFNFLAQYKLALHYFRKTVYLLRSASSPGCMLIPPTQRNECLHLALNNVGQCCVKLEDYEAALNAYLEAILVNPDAASTLIALADLHYFQKRYDASLAIFRRHPELETNPDYAYKKSFVLLAMRRFEEGFALYECRLHNNFCPITKLPARVDVPFLPYWRGPTLDTSCRRLLVVYEQGIGDNVMFFRFLLELASRFPLLDLAYFCKPVVQHLFTFHDHTNIRIVQEVHPDAHDAKVYLMSLPHFLDVRTIHPWPTNYLRRDVERETRWRTYLQALPSSCSKRVGFAMQGLLTHSFVQKVLLLPEVETQLFAVCPDVAFVSLQQDALLTSCTNVYQPPDLDHDEPFVDTVALLHTLDLVVTVDTSIAHLAGVAGVRTLLLLGQGSDWRWFQDEGSCSWYTNVVILRAPQQSFASVLPAASAWIASQHSRR